MPASRIGMMRLLPASMIRRPAVLGRPVRIVRIGPVGMPSAASRPLPISLIAAVRMGMTRLITAGMICAIRGIAATRRLVVTFPGLSAY